MEKRFTQKERSAATRRKILDAATHVLIDQGYAKLTTTKVCNGAGVSQGAIFKHYPSKMALLAALAEDLYASLSREFETLFERRPPDHNVVRRGIRLLWTVFSSERQLASYDLTIASRTDPELRGILTPIVLEHRERIQKIADKVSLEMDMEKKTFYELADIILMAVQGSVINSLAHPDERAVENRLRYLETVARKLAGNPL